MYLKPLMDQSTAENILSRLGTGIGVFSFTNFEMLWCNKSFRKQTWFGTAVDGRKAERVSLFDLFQKEDIEAVTNLVKIAMETGFSYDSERSMRRGSDRRFGAELRFYRVSDDPTASTFCFEFFDLSITKLYEQLSRNERELRQTQHELVNASKAASLGTMAAGVAHEINNPLAIIRGSSDLIQFALNPLDPKRESITRALGKIVRSIDRIAEIIGSLQRFAKGGESLEFAATPLWRVISDALVRCSKQLESGQIEVRYRKPPEDLRLDCQAVHLAQAFLNVMENAIFAVQGRTERWIEIQVENLPETIAISVTDSGKGISTEHRGQIMDPFFTTKEVGHGRGLGLSISKGIVDAHRGRLFLDESSQCTRFTFILPKVQRKSAAA
jgi:C4-dicarboxylate-specific signal transduction histidine kinase